MKKDEIIKITEECLKGVPDLKKRIRLIDVALKKDTYDNCYSRRTAAGTK